MLAVFSGDFICRENTRDCVEVFKAQSPRRSILRGLLAAGVLFQTRNIVAQIARGVEIEAHDF